MSIQCIAIRVRQSLTLALVWLSDSDCNAVRVRQQRASLAMSVNEGSSTGTVSILVVWCSLVSWTGASQTMGLSTFWPLALRNRLLFLARVQARGPYSSRRWVTGRKKKLHSRTHWNSICHSSNKGVSFYSKLLVTCCANSVKHGTR